MLVFQTMPEPDRGLNCVTSTVFYLGPQIVQSTKPSTCRNKTNIKCIKLICAKTARFTEGILLLKLQQDH